MTSTSNTRRRSLQSLQQHGAGLHAVATTLTADPELAAQLVVQAVAAPGTDVHDLRRLSALVVRAWLDGHPERLQTIPSATSTTISLVHGLPDHQRASLALCRFGDHTYREAASLLGLPAVTVAGLLAATLRTLHVSGPSPETDDVTGHRAV